MSYTASLKRVFSSDPSSIATAYDFTDRRVDPDDLVAEHDGEWALVHGVPPGNYRFQIADDQHAKTLGPQFTVQENAGTLEVVVPMGLGGTILGVVIDDRGGPVQGARVTTGLNDPLGPDFPRYGSRFGEEPDATRQLAHTDEQGRFVLSRLAPCDYMLCVVHPRFCEGEAMNLKVLEDGQLVDAGVIQLALGATVSGTTMVAGQPMGQILVKMSTPMTPEIIKAAQDPNATPAEQQEAARQYFCVSVLSDGDGRFKLPKRVPPGTYRVTASRQGSQDMFRVLMDVKESERQVTIVAGQEELTLDFNLPAN